MAVASPDMDASAVVAFVERDVPVAAAGGAGPRLDALVPDPNVAATGGEGPTGGEPAATGLAAAVSDDIAATKR